MRALLPTGVPERLPEGPGRRPGGPGGGLAGALAGALYPAAPRRPLTPRRALIATAAVVVGTAASLSRTGGAGALNSTWIEDSKQFLSSALTEPLPHPILKPFSGYLHVGPRLLTELAVLFPVRWAAPVQTLLAVGMLAVFAAVAYLGSGAFFSTCWPRLVVAAPVLMVPVGHTQADNDVATLQFPSLYALFWLLLWRPAGRVAKVAAVLLAAYVTSSSVLALVLLPLLLVRLFAVRDWTGRAIALGYACGAGLQIAFQVTGRATRDGIGHRTTDLAWLLHAYATRALPRSVLGEVWLGGPGTDGSGVPVPLHTPSHLLHVALIGLAWLIVASAVGLALLRFTRPHWPLAVIAGGANVALFVVQVANMGTVQPRYVIAPALLVYVTLAALLRPRGSVPVAEPLAEPLPLPAQRAGSPGRSPGTGARLLAAGPMLAVALLLAAACAANWRVDNGRARSLPWDAIVRQGEQACATQDINTYRYWYTWWFVDIPCRRLR
jgi:hypothetical protein